MRVREMTTCQVCTAEMKQGSLCRACWADLSRALGRVPDVAAELEITTTRQAVIGPHSEIPHRKGDERPLPYDWSSDHDETDMEGTLAGWISDLEPDTEKHPPLDVTSMAAWMRARGNQIRGLENVAALHDQIMYATGQAWRAVDRPANRTTFKVPYPCPDCGAKVRAFIPTDADEPAMWRCVPAAKGGTSCGAEWEARNWLKVGSRMLKAQEAV
jgi:hypothetical protein